MPKFNIGDRVKVSLASHSPYRGKIGIVTGDNTSSDFGYMVRFEWRGLRPTARFMEEELEVASAEMTEGETLSETESTKESRTDGNNQFVHVSRKRIYLFGGIIAVLALTGTLFVVFGNGARTNTEPSGFSTASANLTQLNQGSSTKTMKLVFESELITATAGESFPVQPVVKIVDDKGNIVTDSTTPVTLIVTDNAAELYGTTTVNPVNGTATFNDLFICVAGNQYKLTAMSTEAKPVYSNSFKVDPGAAESLAFAVEPYGSGLNQNFSTKVAIKDVYGNIVTASTAEVTISLTPGIGSKGAVLSGVTTQRAMDGIASFNYLSIDPGDDYYKLTATSFGLRPAVTFSFNAAKISKVETTQ